MEDYDPTLRSDEDLGCIMKILGGLLYLLILNFAIELWESYTMGMLHSTDAHPTLFVLSLLPIPVGLVWLIVHIHKKKQRVRDMSVLIVKSVIIYIICVTVYMFAIELTWRIMR